jgi:putative chitinase
MNYLQLMQKRLNLTPDGIIGPKTVDAIMTELGLTNKLVVGHVLGQMAHESADFKAFRENMMYSKPQTLANTWGKYSTTGKRGGPPNALAKKIAGKPEIIANTTYGDREDLGNRGFESGDGWRCRGTFGLQLTGRDNLNEFFASIGVPPDTDPDTLKDDAKVYFQAGFFWFTKNNVDDLCTSTSEECITRVTKRVNGGTNGLDDRIVKTNGIFKALGLV